MNLFKKSGGIQLNTGVYIRPETPRTHPLGANTAPGAGL